MYATTFMPAFILCACFCDPNLKLDSLFDKFKGQSVETDYKSNPSSKKSEYDDDSSTYA